MIRTTIACLLATALAACGDRGGAPEKTEGESATPDIEGRIPLQRVELASIADNIRHDTLLIQTTFELGDGSFVMVASNVNETFEGLRLYSYTLLPDSNARVIAYSKPAFDSWTMFPTFFRSPDDPKAFILLANFGEKQSWGQKVMRLDSTGFHDIGFLDVGLPERAVEGDSSWVKVGSIAPHTTIASSVKGLLFTFTSDSLYIYDDLRGGLDVIVDAKRAAYRSSKNGFELGLDGDFKPVASSEGD